LPSEANNHIQRDWTGQLDLRRDMGADAPDEPAAESSSWNGWYRLVGDSIHRFGVSSRRAIGDDVDAGCTGGDRVDLDCPGGEKVLLGVFNAAWRLALSAEHRAREQRTEQR
jgi:hypothetical protein